MPRKEKESLQSLLQGLRDSLVADANKSTATGGRIPTILEFVESKNYLGLPHFDQPIILFPMQRLILKAFYRGSVGNTGPESEFSPEEIQLLKDAGLDNDDRGDVLGKLDNGVLFRELVLVCGRRSGKDFISSIIALYEAMKLLETPGGDPYAVYNLPRGGNPITILTIATSAAQAGIAFAEMKAKLLHSKYFQNKFISEGLTNSQIFLQSPVDQKDDREAKARGLPPVKGSIVIRAGHSNSDGLLGIQCFVLLLDEVASFKATEGSSGGRRIYEAMLPSLNTFIRNKTDKDGHVVYDLHGDPEKVFDSKVVSLSSPRGKEGILYEQFKDAPSKDDRLAFRLPTWVVNPRYPKDALRKSYAQFNDDRFMMEFGADFSSSAGKNFFDEDRVAACFDPTLPFVENGQAGHVYFAHLDPATNSNNYALAICHKEMRVNPETKRADAYVILDHLKFWTPSKEKPIIIDEIDKYILDMNRKFHIGLVTYDAFNSASSIQRLRRAGIPCKMTPYIQKYKNQIYDQLEILVNENRLIVPRPGCTEDDNLLNELVNLQRRYNTGSRGYAVFADKECDTPTDDCCDALAGAVYNSVAAAHERLPLARLVSMPTTQRGAQQSFMSMQGTPYNQRVLDHMRARNGGSTFGFSPPPRAGY